MIPLPRIRPTVRALALAGAACLLGIAGSRFAVEMLVWVAVTLGVFLLFIVAWLGWTISQDRQIFVQRRTDPPQLQVGLTAKTSLTWDERIPFPWLTSLLDSVPGGESLSDGSHKITPTTRGTLTFGPGEVHRSDPFGLFAWRFRIREPDSLIVWPRTDAVGPDVFDQLLGLVRGRNASPSPDIDDLTLREYRHGDPLSRVYWKRHTRQGDLLVRHDEPAQNPDVNLLILPGEDAPTHTAVDIIASAVEALYSPDRTLNLLTPTGGAEATVGDFLTTLALLDSSPPPLSHECEGALIVAVAGCDVATARRLFDWISHTRLQAEAVFIFPTVPLDSHVREILSAFTVVDV